MRGKSKKAQKPERQNPAELQRKLELTKKFEAIIELSGVEVSEFLKFFDADAYNMLRAIVVAKGEKSTVYRTAFDGDAFNKAGWDNVFKLERLGLVESVRNSLTGKIMGFNFNPKLSEIFECDKTIGVYKDPGKTQGEECSVLNLDIKQTQLLQHPTCPKFSGVFELKERVVFNPATKLVYAFWVNNDGDMFLRIEPYDLAMQKSSAYNRPLRDEEDSLVPVGDLVRDFLNRAKPLVLPGKNNKLDDEVPF